MEQKPEVLVKVEDANEPIIKEKIKSRRVLKRIKERDSNYKFFGWDVMENYSYLTYLTNFRAIFDSQALRKKVKVFHHLSMLIKTRNPHQIKSHHQKMMLRHGDVDQISSFLKDRISKEIELHPNYIPIIERINKESEIFFLKYFQAGKPKALPGSLPQSK